jgi:hypothetical protein
MLKGEVGWTAMNVSVVPVAAFEVASFWAM